MTFPAAPVPIEQLLAHREWVRRVARAMVSDENDADDLEQGLWLEALQRPPRSGRSLRGWFFTALRRDWTDARRSEDSRARREESTARPEAIPSAEELVAKADAHTRVAVAVMDLAEPYRSTILYRFFEDLPPSAIAERQGVPVDTVKTRLRRALAQLRERFDAENRGDREKWCLALLPLLRRSLNTSAARGTAAAAAGVIVMGAKVKVVVALVIVAAAGVLFWTSRTEVSEVASTPAVSKEQASAETRRPAPPTAPQPVATKFGVDGMTRIGETPAIAQIGAWSAGTSAAVADDTGAATVLGRPWYEAPEPPLAAAQTSSSASGEFSLHGLGVGTWLVVATFGDGRRAAQTVELTAEAPRARVDLSAAAGGCSLRGRAVHGDGTPFVGWIGFQTIGRPRSTEVWITSDATGAFAIAGLPIVPRSASFARVADVLVEALQAGKSLAVVQVELPYEGEVLLVVDAPGPVRHGRVLAAADDTPIAGARVLTRAAMTVGHPAGGTVQSFATTGPDGRFDFVFSGGGMPVSVEADGFVSASLRDDGQGDEFVVRLLKSAVLTGKVVRADDGTPAAGAVVHVASAESGAQATSRATSEADGTFRVSPRVVGHVDVYALGGGWASEKLAEADKKGFDPFARDVQQGSASDLVLRVVPSARVEGRVIDAKDHPVADVPVEARRAPPPVTPLAGPVARAVTQTDGSFRFDDLVPDAAWTFTVRPIAGEPKSSAPTRLESGRATKIEIRLDPTKRVAVTVLAADTSAPIANALISVATAAHGPWDSWSGPPTPWTTGTDGTADVGPVGSSCFGVYARAEGYVEGNVVPEVVDDATLRAVIRLEAGKPITGRVVVPDGLPMEYVRVCASVREPQTFTFTRPDASGAFRFDTLRDQTWDLRATATWSGRSYSARSSALTGDTGVVLTLAEVEQPRSIRIRVSDAQGSPLKAGVVKYVFGGVTGGEVAVASGVALVPFPPTPANGTLIVQPTPSGAAGSGTARVALPDPLPSEFDVRLPGELRITGRVIGPTGDGVEGVRVLAQPVNTGVYSRGGDQDAHATALTRQYGDFEIGGLGEITYSLRCAPAPNLAQFVPVTARAGATGVEIRLSAAATATVTVKGPDGTPLGGCTVILQLGGTSAGWAATGSSGNAQLTGLDATAAYRLLVVPHHEGLIDTAIGSWTPHDTTVQLEGGGGGEISGIVRDDAGQAIPWATVFWFQGSSGSSVAAGRDGRFRITGVRLNESARLRAQLEGEQNLAGRMPKLPDDLQARPGATDVVLVAHAADAVSFRVEGLPDGAATRWTMGTQDARGEMRENSGYVKTGGVIRIRGLDPSRRHRLLVGPTGDGRYGLVENVVVGGPEVSVRLTQGGVITGQVRWFNLMTPEGKPLRVSVQDMLKGGYVEEMLVTAHGDLWSVRGTVDANGRFRIACVPAGGCSVGVSASKDGKLQYLGNAAASPGDDVVIDMDVYGLPK
jgi:RNA polymerase sigma factor (sigma-70 family)